MSDETEPEKKLMIVFVGQNTLIGESEGVVGGMWLKRPRAIQTGKDPQGRPIIGMSPLVGLPDEVQILDPLLMYEVRDKEMINLYIKSTTNIIPAGDLSGLPPGVLSGGPRGRG